MNDFYYDEATLFGNDVGYVRPYLYCELLGFLIYSLQWAHS